MIVDDGLSLRPRTGGYTDLIFAIQKLKQVDDTLACTIRFNRNIDTELLTSGEFRQMFDIYWTDRENNDEKREWDSIEITSYKTNTIDFTAFIDGTTTVRGVLVAKVRPQYDYTRVFLSDPQKTYLTNLNATKEFNYIKEPPEPVETVNATEPEPMAEAVPEPPIELVTEKNETDRPSEKEQTKKTKSKEEPSEKAGPELGVLGLALTIAAVVVGVAILTVVICVCRNREEEDDAIVVAQP